MLTVTIFLNKGYLSAQKDGILKICLSMSSLLQGEESAIKQVNLCGSWELQRGGHGTTGKRGYIAKTFASQGDSHLTFAQCLSFFLLHNTKNRHYIWNREEENYKCQLQI